MQFNQKARLLKAAKHLLLAATVPEEGPTSWNEARNRWIHELDQICLCEYPELFRDSTCPIHGLKNTDEI